jgi:glycogen(starch) synthase
MARILFWTQLFLPYIGGVQILAAKTLPMLRRRGYQFALITSHGNRDLPDVDSFEGIPVYRFRFWEALAARDVELLVKAKNQVAELKRAFNPDLIHIHLTDPSVFFHLQTAQVCPAPMLVSLRVGLIRQPGQTFASGSLLKQTFSAAAWITTNSNALLAEARGLFPEISSLSSVIYNGMEFPDIEVEPLPLERPRLVCAGRLVSDKGFDIALAAMASLVARFPRLQMTIVGDGPARGQLERQALALGLGKTVTFAGWVDPGQIPAFMKSATIVVMPSRWEEAFGLVALEAALMGRPVVATRVGGLPEVVVDRETGLIVHKDDSEALADAIASLLDQPQQAMAMGNAGRLRAQQIFSLQRYVDAYDALYRTLIH